MFSAGFHRGAQESMTNNEVRMTKEIPMPQFRNQLSRLRTRGLFALRHSLVIMVSSFVILSHRLLEDE
jgi:hypothetical protein